MDRDQFLAFVQAFLASSGWSLFPQFSAALSFKFFDTAVGRKEAQIYLVQDEFTWVLSGLYESQGRNILSTASVLIPKDCSVIQLPEFCSKFLTNVESAISSSYAVRLL